MKNKLETGDIIVFLIYILIVAGYGYWVYRRRQSKENDTKSFSLQKVRSPGGRSVLP